MSDIVISYFCNHLVCLGGYVNRAGEPQRYVNASGFVIAIDDYWFLATAGHVIEQFDELKRQGYVIDRWHLNDTAGSDVTSDIPIPFDFDRARRLTLYDEDAGIDYAVIYLTPYYRQLLERNGIVPLTDEVWRYAPQPESDVYWLLGVPAETVEELTSSGANTVMTAGYCLLPITLIQGEPPDALRKPTPRLYANLPDRELPHSIAGMSGGPIFAVRSVGEEYRYWLVAVQSGWLPRSGVIAACPMSIFAEWLRGRILDATDEHSRSTGG